MLLQLPPEYVGQSLYQGIKLYFWIAHLIIVFITSILFFLQGKKLEMKSQKAMNYGYGSFFSLFGLLRIFFMLGVYFPDNGGYDFFTNLGYISGILGVIGLLYVLETYMVPKTKKIFLIISVIAFAICLIALIFPGASRNLALEFIYYLMPIAVGFIVILYVYLISKTTGIVRKKAQWVLIGLLIIVVGHMMDTSFFISALPQVPQELAPIIMSTGIIVFLISQFKIK